jgi:orotate phosphoribosyltransferase
LLAREEIEQTIGFEHLDSIAGGETAGIPYAAWISDALMLPMQYVRKKPKGFGRMAQIEGSLEENSNVLLVEDLATDGGSKLSFVKAIRNAGAKCNHTFVVFFYGAFPGAIDSLKKEGVSLLYLSTWADVIEAAEDGGYFDADKISDVRDFLKDPIGWSQSHGGRGAD